MYLQEIRATINQYATWNTFYRAYNAAVAGVVMLDFMQNPTPQKAIEYLPDIALHSFEALFPNSEDVLVNELALVVNGMRGLQAINAAVTGNSEIPLGANLADIPNHALNIYHRVRNINKLVAERQATDDVKKDTKNVKNKAH